MNEDELRSKFREDFIFFAKKSLYIRTKSGNVELFNLNKAQGYIHEQLEKQKAETGKVRALVLKGRQQGCSTLVAARYYHRVTQSIGTRVFILTHDGEATSNLFNIANRYHENAPSFVKPETGKSNTKELSFNGLDGGYKVGTAGNKNVGRSSTIQLLHGSECAFWDNANDIASGVMQAVPDAKNTEIILESTANGIGGLYYDMCMDALRGDGEYILIFTPWFWQDEYKRNAKDIILTAEEQDYKRAHQLTNEQISWRRNKIQELKSAWLFKQEYPANVMEAFQTSGDDSFISAEIVQAARHGTPIIDKDAPLIIGVDPARFGDDRTAICFREGRVISKILTYKHKDTMDVRDIVAQIIDLHKPLMVNIDVGGLGAGVYDGLLRFGYGDIVREVNFGGKAINDDRYKNKRAEMWGEMREWLNNHPVQIPNSDSLQADLIAPHYKFDNNQRLQLESKDDMKKRGVKSPDCFVGDTLISTPSGDRRIDSLGYGDKVITPMGVRYIIKVHKTQTGSITTATFDNGVTLSGKGKHKIFTWGRGFISLDSLVYSDNIESTKGLYLWNILNQLYMTDKHIGFKALATTISRGNMIRRKDFYIGTFGAKLMERFQKAVISTISMVGGGIMIFQTCSVLHQESIVKSTRKLTRGIVAKRIENNLRQSIILQKRGTHPMRGWNGIERTGGLLGKIERSTPHFVLYVVKSIRHMFHQSVSFVLGSAHRKERMRNKRQYLAFALTVIKNFLRINTNLHCVALTTAPTNAVDVYNLTLDYDNVYYANGMLVENCADAAALCFAYKVREPMRRVERMKRQQQNNVDSIFY